MYIAMKALSVPARYYYVRRLSLRKQEGMDGGCGPVSYIIVPPDLNWQTDDFRSATDTNE